MNTEGSRKTHMDGIKTFFDITNFKDLKVNLKNYNKIRKTLDTAKITQKLYGLCSTNSKKIYVAAVLYCIDHLHILVPATPLLNYRIWFDELKAASTKKNRGK